ncbi:MAG: hypothetical protein EOR57_14115 [Mesorhizobium sp.]|uniref:hypothetical protein n=1 Tax=Mesorhizobium sp. TaxID=1871066 RepID=UPI000FE7A79A|nr:hypothetical protein [Mesorhizobium sp.]RWL19724.1 MAG: hypothetical protein EOR57_14115 [Mesorhizobium sp.]
MATTSVDQVTGYGETVAYKAPCRLATTANIVLSGLQTIDGSVTAANDRILVKNQSTASQNGVYIAASGAWSRARDMDSNRDLTKGTRVAVTDGTVGATTVWAVTAANPITVGTTSITFANAFTGELVANLPGALDDAIHDATAKSTPVDADEMLLWDSVSAAIRKITWANVKAGILAYFNGTAKALPIDADRVWSGDSTASNVPVYSTWTQVKAFLKTYFDTLYQAIDAQLSSLIRQNSQSAAYTLVLTDSGKHIYHPAADTTARIWTIPANASVAFPIGTAVTFDNDFGAGVITIAITSDTLVLVGTVGSTGSRTLASGGQATAIKVTATRWRISGTGLT